MTALANFNDRASGYRGLATREKTECLLLTVLGLIGIVLPLFLMETRSPSIPVPDAPAVVRLIDVPDHPEPSPRPVPATAQRLGKPHGGAPGTEHHQAPKRTDAPPQQNVSDISLPPVPLAIESSAASGLGLLSASSNGADQGHGTSQGSGVGRGGNGDGGGAPQYAKAQWVREPTSEDFEHEWPASAAKTDQPVTVIMQCKIMPGNKPRNCKVLQENPGHSGFGPAAVRLVEQSRIRAVLKDGSATDLPVIVPLTFNPLTVGIRLVSAKFVANMH